MQVGNILMRIILRLLTMLFLSVCAAQAQSDELPEDVLFYNKGNPEKPAIVLAHDWFGDSLFYRNFSEDLAAQGYTVIASDLYQGAPGAKNHQEAGRLFRKLSRENAIAVLDANIALASERSNTVVTIGFSAGVPHILDAAVRNNESVDAAIVFYGASLTDTNKLANLGGPILAIYGSKDPIYGADGAAADAARFSKAADEAQARVDIHIFGGADHAFAQPLYNGGNAYDPIATEAAWNLAIDFIDRTAQMAKTR